MTVTECFDERQLLWRRVAIECRLQLLSRTDHWSDSVLDNEQRPFNSNFSQRLQWHEVQTRRQLQCGSLCNSESESTFDGFFVQGSERSMDGLPSVTVVDASCISRRCYLSTALSPVFSTVSAIGTLKTVLDQTDVDILSSTALA